MAITGNPKIFKKAKNLFKDGASATATSNDALAKLMLDTSLLTAWESSGSDDTTTETLVIDFPASVTIDRLFILVHNLKDFSVEYYDGVSAYQNFTNVVGLDGSVAGGIIETAFADDCAYYEFDAVTTTQIRIQATKTQTADQEKQIARVVATEELGTWLYYPQVKGLTISKNAKTQKLLSGRRRIIKTVETASFGFTLKANSNAEDLALAETMLDSLDPMLIWLCGGRRGTTYFKVTTRGYRLRDLYSMDVEGDLPLNYVRGILVNPFEAKLSFAEVPG